MCVKSGGNDAMLRAPKAAVRGNHMLHDVTFFIDKTKDYIAGKDYVAGDKVLRLKT